MASDVAQRRGATSGAAEERDQERVYALLDTGNALARRQELLDYMTQAMRLAFKRGNAPLMASLTSDRSANSPKPKTFKLMARLERHTLAAAVFAGGCIGALARAGLSRAIPAGHDWPWATFVANLVGTALLAWFATRLQERLPPSTYRRPLLGTGLCGALTTFSTLQIELIRLARDGRPGLAALYLAVTLLGGITLMFIVTRLVRRARIR